jgi:hypothetical protein
MWLATLAACGVAKDMPRQSQIAPGIGGSVAAAGGVAAPRVVAGESGSSAEAAASASHDGGTEPPDAGGYVDLRAGHGAFPVCDVMSTDLSGFDAPTPLGFTAEQVFGLAVGSHSASMQWTDTFPFLPADANDTVDVAVARRGSPRFKKLTPRTVGDGHVPEDACPSMIEVDAHVALTSSNGALAESFDTVLTASESDMLTSADPGGTIIKNFEIKGQLHIDSSKSRQRLNALLVSLTFTLTGMTGQVDASVIPVNGGLNTVNVAKW